MNKQHLDMYDVRVILTMTSRGVLVEFDGGCHEDGSGTKLFRSMSSALAYVARTAKQLEQELMDDDDDDGRRSRMREATRRLNERRHARVTELEQMCHALREALR